MGINGNRSNETLSREISRRKAVVIISGRRFLDFARNDDGVNRYQRQMRQNLISPRMTVGVSTLSSSRAELRAALETDGNRSNDTLSREISRGKAVVIISGRRFLEFARNDDGVNRYQRQTRQNFISPRNDDGVAQLLRHLERSCVPLWE